MRRGLILFAHGARDAGWAEPFEALRARVTNLAPTMPARLVFLELMQPDLQGATADLVAAWVDAIRIVPISLGQGRHLRRDLPERVSTLRTEYPQVEFVCTLPAGEDGAVVDAIADSAWRPGGRKWECGVLGS
jgi:sirohydrochlorin cobaltochelatase